MSTYFLLTVDFVGSLFGPRLRLRMSDHASHTVHMWYYQSVSMIEDHVELKSERSCVVIVLLILND